MNIAKLPRVPRQILKDIPRRRAFALQVTRFELTGPSLDLASSPRGIMKKINGYRAVEPEDLAILFLSVGEIGAMALSAALMLVLVWLVSGPI